MTALEQFVRLEAQGRWREHSEADWRDVLVSFGNATLVLSDFSEEPLTHWSLAAVERIGTSSGAAVYIPDMGLAETLEVRDTTMIEAIAEVSKLARMKNRPKERRSLRRWVLAALAVIVVGALVFWAPDALRTQAFRLITPEQAEAVSDAMRPALPGFHCTTPEGVRSLNLIARRVDPAIKAEVRSWDAPALTQLPDGTILLGRKLVETAASAEDVAGWIALAAQAGSNGSPLFSWTRDLGLAELGGFLSTGEIPPAEIARMARSLPATPLPPDAATTDRAFRVMAERRIDSAGLSRALNRDAPDPDADPRPVLDQDRDWVALQNICVN